MQRDPAEEHWILDPRLEADTVPVGKLALCEVRLNRDATYPWLILVPRRHNATEIFALPDREQAQLMAEVSGAGRALSAMTDCNKINIAALGNVVSQLHIHVIARFRSDPAWPNPVWNAVPPRPYDSAALRRLTHELRQRLSISSV